MSTVIYRLKVKTMSVNIIRLYFNFISLFAQHLSPDMYKQAEYQTFVANYITPDGKQTTVHTKKSSLLALVSIKLLTLMPAYSAIFPPRRMAFST